MLFYQRQHPLNPFTAQSGNAILVSVIVMALGLVVLGTMNSSTMKEVARVSFEKSGYLAQKANDGALAVVKSLIGDPQANRCADAKDVLGTAKAELLNHCPVFAPAVARGGIAENPPKLFKLLSDSIVPNSRSGNWGWSFDKKRTFTISLPFVNPPAAANDLADIHVNKNIPSATTTTTVVYNGVAADGKSLFLEMEASTKINGLEEKKLVWLRLRETRNYCRMTNVTAVPYWGDFQVEGYPGPSGTPHQFATPPGSKSHTYLNPVTRQMVSHDHAWV